MTEFFVFGAGILVAALLVVGMVVLLGRAGGTRSSLPVFPRWTAERMEEETQSMDNWRPGMPDPRFYPRITREEWDQIPDEVRERNTRAKERMLNKLERRR